MKLAFRLALILTWFSAQILLPVLHLRQHEDGARMSAAGCAFEKGQSAHLHHSNPGNPEAPCALCRTLASLGQSLSPSVSTGIASALDILHCFTGGPSPSFAGVSSTSPRGPPVLS
jgi:hypothetical protein